MARIPLRLVGWEYDDATNRVRAVFTDGPVDDDPDPANFKPTRLVALSDTEIDAINPDAPKIAELNDVVDQLILDSLMGGF